MKRLIWLLVFCSLQLNAQTIRIAISDFENLSGNAKYDGLGKALSSMLISDIEVNVSKKRLQLVERSQLNKIIKEQSLQSGKAFDKNTAVRLGKLLGINFILVGDIFVLNDDLIINARLTNVENGEIKFSNKQIGKLSQWLGVKTKIAKELSDNLNMPFAEPTVKDKEISLGILASYSSAIDEFDKGNFEKAVVISETLKSISPDFNYVDDLKLEIDKIKKEVALLKKEVETVAENPIEVASNFIKSNDYENAIKYYKIGLSRISNSEYGNKYVYFNLLSKTYFDYKDYNNSILYADSVLSINPLESAIIAIKASSLMKQGDILKGKKVFDEFISKCCSNRNSVIVFTSLYKLSVNKNLCLKGLSINMTSGEISFDHKFNFLGYDDFKNKLNIYDDQIITSIISNGFEFNQEIDLNYILSEYGYLLEQSNYAPKDIAKIIMDFNFGVDTTNFFHAKGKSKEYSGLRGNIRTGNLTGSKFVMGKNGQVYEGPVYIDNLTNEIYSALESNNNYIKCPCDLLIEKDAFDELINSNGNIDINKLENASKVFHSAWFNLIGGEFSASRNKYYSVIKYYIKLSGSNNGGNLKPKDFDLFRMATINLAHAYLLDKKYKEAADLYKKDIFKDDFGDDWGNMTTHEILKKDWEDFVSSKLISRKVIDDFSKTYLKN